MESNDFLLMCILEVLLLLASGAQLALERKKGLKSSPFRVVQAFVFPLLLLIGLILFAAGRDYVFPLVAVGLVQEILFRILRKKPSTPT